MRVAVVAVLAIGGASYAGLAAAQTDHDVSIGDNVYEPESIAIAVGDTVVWTHEGARPHSVTSDPNQADEFDSSPTCPTNPVTDCMQAGATFEYTFETAGTFTYFCRVHGTAMSGQVVVGGAQPTESETPSETPLPTGTPLPTVSPTVTPTPTPSLTPTPTPTPTPTLDETPQTGGGTPAAAVGAALIVLAGLALRFGKDPLTEG